jgi:hypothetical protein
MSSSQAGLNSCALPMISIHGKPTVAPLRYILAGYRPSKTVHLALSSMLFANMLSEFCHISKRGVTLSSRLNRDSLLHCTIKMHKTIPNYSQAPRGLFVLVELGRVFTANAISPSNRLRQLSARDAIRAGRNLPDKELRYRRTVIVTAAVYWSFMLEQIRTNPETPLYLTYQHWAGVSPYTVHYCFAGTCVFDKQSTDKLWLRPHC